MHICVGVCVCVRACAHMEAKSQHEASSPIESRTQWLSQIGWSLGPWGLPVSASLSIGYRHVLPCLRIQIEVLLIVWQALDSEPPSNTKNRIPLTAVLSVLTSLVKRKAMEGWVSQMLTGLSKPNLSGLKRWVKKLLPPFLDSFISPCNQFGFA